MAEEIKKELRQKSNDVTKKLQQKNNAAMKNIHRLKKAWERLKARQAFVPLRKARIYSVNIVDDGKGGKTLQVIMSDGGKFNDEGNKKNLFHSMERRRKHSFSRLMSLVALARIAGVDTVSSNLPPRVRRAFMRVYSRHGSRNAPVQKVAPEKMSLNPQTNDVPEKESLNQELQNISKRQSFTQNAIIQDMINKNGGR